MNERLASLSGFLTAPLNRVYEGVYGALMRPPKEFWGLLALGISAVCLGIWANRRWIEAKPNEWLLVIRDGKMVKAGVGLKTWATFLDTIVTFPSKVERVWFQANNVTVEMQGIIIEGFAFWSVYREDDGPFRCYKYMQGCNPNQTVKGLCESVLRNLIANSTIDEVMKNRNHLRKSMNSELKDQFKGWGIWLESVEITEARISSDRLFKDLQAEFRQKTRLEATVMELESKQKMTEAKKRSQMIIFQKNELNETKRLRKNLGEDLKRKEQEEAYLSSKSDLEVEKLVRERELQLQRVRNEKEKEVERLQKDQGIQDKELDFRIREIKEQIDLDKMHDQSTLKKYRIDATARIYASMAVKELKVNKFGDSSLLQLLPILAASQ